MHKKRFLLLLINISGLNLLKIQQLRAELECVWKGTIKFVLVLLDLFGMLVFKFTKGMCILLLCLEELMIPLLVKIMILLSVCFLAFFFLMGMSQLHLCFLLVPVLYLELGNLVLGFFSFDIATILNTFLHVFLQLMDVLFNVLLFMVGFLLFYVVRFLLFYVVSFLLFYVVIFLLFYVVSFLLFNVVGFTLLFVVWIVVWILVWIVVWIVVIFL